MATRSAAPKTTIYANGVPYTATSTQKAQSLALKDNPGASVSSFTAAPVYTQTPQEQAQSAYNAGKATEVTTGGTTPPPGTTGTLTAQITTPKSLQKTGPAPAVVTSTAAEKDLANKKAQMDALNQDVVNHQAAVNTPVQSPTDTSQSKDDSTQEQQKPLTLDEQISQMLGDENANVDTVDANVETEMTPLAQEMTKVQTQYDKQAATTLKRLDQISTGTYPLSPAEKSLLDATRKTFLNTIEAQKTANQGYQGQITEAMASLGIDMTAPTEASGQMFAVISAGNEKVADLDAKMATSLADLQIGFQKEDYAEVSDAWTKTADNFDKRINTIKEMQSAVVDAANAQKKEMRERTEFAINTMITSAKFSYDQIKDTIDQAFRERQLDETVRHNLTSEAISRQKKASTITREDAKAFGLPVKMIGMDEDQFLSDMNDNVPPAWFVDKIQTDAQSSLDEDKREELWSVFKDGVDSHFAGADDNSNPFADSTSTTP